MPSLGWQELTIVLVIVIIIFGAGKLPEIGGALGKSIKEFKSNSEDELGSGKKDAAATTSTTTRTAEPTTVASGRQELRPDEI